MSSEKRLNINVELFIQFIKETSSECKRFFNFDVIPNDSYVIIRNSGMLTIMFPYKIGECNGIGGYKLEDFINWLEDKLSVQTKKIKKI